MAGGAADLAERSVEGGFSDGPVDFRGMHYTVTGHEGLPKPVQRPHPPIVIGGGGKRVLSVAAREADIVSVNPNLKEGLGGAETAPNMTPERTTQKIAWAREAAGDRFDDIELNVLIGFALLTDTTSSIAEAMAPAAGISPADALHVPVCLLGTVDFMVDELRRRRDESGFSYVGFDGGSWETMAPVVSRLVGT